MACNLAHTRRSEILAASQDYRQLLSDTTPFRFRDLPSELRLNVYHRIVMTDLYETEICNIRSIFLSCRQIHQEMGTEHVSTMRQLLQVIHRWKTTSEETRLLRIQLENGERLADSFPTTTIVIPTTIFPEQHTVLPGEYTNFNRPEPWHTTSKALSTSRLSPPKLDSHHSHSWTFRSHPPQPYASTILDSILCPRVRRWCTNI
jgi:hypothetical protein